MSTDPFDATADSGGEHAGARVALAVGAQLGKYRLERILGEGAMGVVWAARDPDLERSIAIKLLLSADASPEQRARLLREARAMARLKHPNVLTVYEVDSDGDRDYIVMELVDGTSLQTWLETHPPFDERWHAVVAAGRGLAAAHAAGLVHRDFKPHNVLRGRDGRVLVTDFGLARGLGDDPTGGIARSTTLPPKTTSALDITISAPERKSDALLDSTLTEPGALMGTPAYMAPEQFLGTAPDPRTDQFAYCVTAWQVLDGERPFRGTTIDELRRACTKGVEGVETRLPRAIRAVLARGLAPDPETRWPDLDALLDALDRAHQAPRWRRAIGFAIFGFAIAAALALLPRHHADERPVATAGGCEPPERAFAAWTPARRTLFETRFSHHPNAAAMADALDAFRDAWLRRYHDACTTGSGAKASARLNCLLGERDDLDGLARLTDTIPTSSIAGMDLWGLLPALEACDGDSPVAPPLLPEDRKLRDQIVSLRAQLIALRLDPERFLAREDELVQHAKKLGWKPLVAEVEAAIGSAAQIVGDDDKARARFETAAEDAERLADFKVEATARIGLLEVELDDTADPTDPDRAKRLIEQAIDAVQRAGGNPALANSIDNLQARLDVARGVAGGIDRYDAARKKLLALGALRAASVSATNQARALEARDRDPDLETAWQVARDTEHAIEASGRSVPHNQLGGELIELAWRRGDLDETHARADKLDTPTAPTAPTTIAGHVIGPSGAPAAGARVVAWHGALAGDSTRLYTRPAFDGALAVTDATGAFTIDAPAEGGLVAELGALRSPPVPIAKGVTLKLAATRAIAGRVDATDASGVDAVVRIAVGHDAVWSIRARVGRDHTFALAGLPATPATLGLDGSGVQREGKTIFAGPPRDDAKLTWPNGPSIDVIVRIPNHDALATVYVLRGRTIPRTRVELFGRVDESDVATGLAAPIGLDNATPEGQPIYAKRDLHRVIRDNLPGDVTVCVVWSGDPKTPPSCTVTTLAPLPSPRPARLPAVVVVLPATR